MFPNGAPMQILGHMRHLCTQNRDIEKEPRQLCYKTHSGAKPLIHNDLDECHFSGQLSQALDFPGLGGHRMQSINKVIHIILG
jgi:hypothetical protein